LIKRKNAVYLDGDGRIAIEFCKSLPFNMHAMPLFGNVRGVRVLTRKNHVVGVAFDNDVAMELFFNSLGTPVPEELRNIVNELKTNCVGNA